MSTMWKLFLGDFVRLHILHHAAKRLVSWAEFVTKLNGDDYSLNRGRGNAELCSLEEAGYLTGSFIVVSGKRRKHYEATAKGRKVIEVAKTRLYALASDVLR